ncbi:MAG: NAD-dependent epimerase/dehydratase family protein [Gaiellales bacterium]
MRAIVTGGAGFIGSHVAEALLARGDEVHVVDDLSRGSRANVPTDAELHVADIREPLGGLFDGIRPERVFHLAAQIDVRVSVADPVADAAANVVGTIRVLQAAQPHGARVVFTSTGGAIYGECAEPAAEPSAREPLSPYGTSKLAAEEYLAMWNRLYATSHVALRLGNVYGPRQDPHGEAGVVAIFLQKLADNEPATIFGDGSQERDYVFAPDVARAMLAAAETGAGVYNIGTGVATSVVSLWEACCAASGRSGAALNAPPRLGELQRSVLDIRAAARELGWSPAVSLADGLGDTWRWLSAS